MTLFTIAKRLEGKIGGSLLNSQNAVSNALGQIYDSHDWSFQKMTAGWLCPGMIANSGTSTTTPYSNQVLFDNPSSMRLGTYVGPPLLTQLQYRNPSYLPYNIIGQAGAGTIAGAQVLTPGAGQTPGTYNLPVTDTGGGTGGIVQVIVTSAGTVTVNGTSLAGGSGYVTPVITLSAGGTPATFAVIQNQILTLDRVWSEPTVGGGQPFQIYQVYFVSPVPDFRKFVSISDPTDNAFLDFWTYTQADLAVLDAQRQEFQDSAYVVPAGIDQRPGSATFGYQMFELWPHQTNFVPYTFILRRKGPMPASPLDFFSTTLVPYPLDDDMIEQKARVVLCEDAEANRDRLAPKGSGANWLLLSQLAQKRYLQIANDKLAIDLNLDGEAQTHTKMKQIFLGRDHATMGGQLVFGGYPGR